MCASYFVAKKNGFAEFKCRSWQFQTQSVPWIWKIQGWGPSPSKAATISANCVSYSRKRPNPIAAGELFCRLGLHHFVHLHLGMCFLELGGFYSNSTVKSVLVFLALNGIIFHQPRFFLKFPRISPTKPPFGVRSKPAVLCESHETHLINFPDELGKGSWNHSHLTPRGWGCPRKLSFDSTSSCHLWANCQNCSFLLQKRSTLS